MQHRGVRIRAQEAEIRIAQQRRILGAVIAWANISLMSFSKKDRLCTKFLLPTEWLSCDQFSHINGKKTPQFSFLKTRTGNVCHRMQGPNSSHVCESVCKHWQIGLRMPFAWSLVWSFPNFAQRLLLAPGSPFQTLRGVFAHSWFVKTFWLANKNVFWMFLFSGVANLPNLGQTQDFPSFVCFKNKIAV